MRIATAFRRTKQSKRGMIGHAERDDAGRSRSAAGQSAQSEEPRGQEKRFFLIRVFCDALLVISGLRFRIQKSQLTRSALENFAGSSRCIRCGNIPFEICRSPAAQSTIMANTRSSNPNQAESGSAKSKKTAPINHVILKRIGDLKKLVADLSDAKDGSVTAALDVGTEIQKQSSEIEALRNELQNFQSGILSSFCDALDERLTQPSVELGRLAREERIHTAEESAKPALLTESPASEASPAVTQSPKKNTSAEKAAGDDGESSPGLKADTWEAIRSAFLNEHEVETVPGSGDATQFDLSQIQSGALAGDNSTGDGSASAQLDIDQRSGLSAVSSLMHLDNVEDSEDDLDFKHSDIIADLDSLDESTLRSVIDKQEQLILGLIRRLRTRYNNRPTMTGEQLATVQDLAGEELSAEIRQTLTVLHSQQRQGELELSLERAKLSRRRTELDQLEARIEGRARTLGVTINENGSLEDATAVDRGTGSKSRRWLGAMGFGDS